MSTCVSSVRRSGVDRVRLHPHRVLRGRPLLRRRHGGQAQHRHRHAKRHSHATWEASSTPATIHADAIMGIRRMEPLAHTLAGACLAESGLKRLSPLASSTLIIAANLPDVDGACYLHSADLAFAFRRGWTHGILAIALLPLALTAAMLARRSPPRARRHPERPRAEAAGPAGPCRPRRALPPVPRLAEQLRRPAPDAVLGPLVLRRHAVHRRPLALADPRRRRHAGVDDAHPRPRDGGGAGRSARRP